MRSKSDSGFYTAARCTRLNAIPVLAGILSVFLLGGCAAQSAFQDARNLIANDKVEAGLARLQDAMKLDPDNIEIKEAYIRTRDWEVRNLVEQADQLLEVGQREGAENIYGRVLEIDPGNERARAGMQMVARDARHAALLDAAATDLENKDIDAGKAKLSLVLTENPKNNKARMLLRTIVDKSPLPVSVLEPQLAAAYRQPISIDFKDASLKQIFDVIARTSGLNIIYDKEVKTDQKTSIILKDSTIEAAIYYMLLTNQLEQQAMDANTLLIYPVSKQKDYQQMVVKTFLLENAKASSVAESIKTIIKMHDVVVDDKLNMLLVRDNPDAIRLAEKLIATQDVPEPEVMLEVEILEVSRERLLELGVALPGSLTLTPLSATTGTSTGPLTLSDLRHLNGSSTGVTIDPLKVNARKVDTDVEILANPRIRVLNHEKAKIVIGDRVPSISSSAVPSANGTIISEAVNYLDVGLKLEVEPTIFLDNDVAIRIGLEVSNIVNTQTTSNGTVAYTIGTRTANTMLRLKDGENQVLAGLINNQDQRTANKFPGMGDIPILGRLFGSTLHDGKKSEVVLSITPHLIRNIKRLDAATSEFPSGTENSLRRRPDLSTMTKEPQPNGSSTISKSATPKPANVVPAPAPIEGGAGEMELPPANQ